ncbi:bifunctional ornithine acetyltransferase/N-acetylglutamate synthase [bacterium F11]|nr:bifunctional ornithine acetyltransferase/N-acetylglutamate synthase [bacterium F11]
MNSTNWPIGYSAIGINSKLSYKKSKKDLALFYSHLPASGAGVFTQNRVKAAPILITQERLIQSRGKVRAILVNSGSANAATGQEGLRDAKKVSQWLEQGLELQKQDVWLASTGLIGVRVKLRQFRSGIKNILKKIGVTPIMEGKSASEAILTTDTKPKVASLSFSLGGVPVKIWGCAKGSGMIHPNLKGPTGKLHATMLSFILTDAAVKPYVLQRALEKVTDKTFNCVSIDGDTSTNDFVAVMANGGSNATEITHPRGHLYQTFCSALHEIAERLTTKIALDGEGASRLVHVFIEGARSEKAARDMAANVASSPLVKTACHGADPNWGRVLMALGHAGVPFDPNRVKIWLGDMLVCQNGKEISFPEKKAIDYMRRKKIVIRVNLGLGTKWSRYKTCDFTGHYVGINAGYRT